MTCLIQNTLSTQRMSLRTKKFIKVIPKCLSLIIAVSVNMYCDNLHFLHTVYFEYTSDIDSIQRFTYTKLYKKKVRYIITKNSYINFFPMITSLLTTFTEISPLFYSLLIKTFTN